MSAPVVAQATPAERAAFIGRTYVHLLGAILLFAALEVTWFVTPVASTMIRLMMGGGNLTWLLFMGAFVGVSYFANSWALRDNAKPLQYAGLGLFAVFESILFVPLIAMALIATKTGDPYILPRAMGITAVLFAGLTGIVFLTRKDFSFMRGVLMFAGFAAFAMAVGSMIFGFSLGIFFSYAMVALAGGYILYHTSNIMLHYRTNQHVAASLALFSSVMLLFWYVLRIFLARRR
ncbi:MAG: US12 family protein [Sandaracinaceae bacterium]|nr:US12 family protein [Sandaracinaceae bacterium]